MINGINDILSTSGSNEMLKKIESVNGKAEQIKDTANKGESFKELLSNFVNGVSEMQHEADDSVNKLATGEITDVHDVMVKVEEANLSFQLMMEIRNKLVDGYKEVMRMQV